MNVHKLRMDTSGNVEDISFVLARKNGDKLGNIPNTENVVTKHSFKEASEFTFAAHKKMNNNVFKYWDELKDFKLVWIPEWDMWYEATVEINEKDDNIKNVSGKTLGEAELSQIMLYGIEINTETDIARDDYEIPTTFYNSDHPEASLMNRLLDEKAPHYTIKHIDKSLMNLQRTFTFDDISLYDAFQEISEELDCLFVFGCGSDENDKPERTISVYDLEANCLDCGNRDTFVHKCPKCGSENILLGYGEYTNVFISKDNLADEITYSVDTDSVKNCFKLEAGDDLMTAAIRSCNPNGTDYIYYFPAETRAEMSQELQDKLKSYDALYEKYQSDYNFTINDSFVTNYNALINKYKTYEESLKDTAIKNPIVGYPKLMRIYFDTIDMVQLLKNKLMPPIDKPDNNAKSQGEYLMANLPSSASTTSLKNLSVSTADNIMVMLAQSIVKGVFKVTVTNTTLSNNVWKGKFNLENYSDKDDTFTSQFVSISINENYESYVKQRIDSILARADENYYDIVGLFKQDMTVFKSQLKKYCLNTLQIFQKCCQSCIDMMVQQGVSSNSTSSIYGINTKVLYENVYVPYYNKMNAIQDEIKVREDELYTVEGKYNNQNQLVQDGIQIEIERIITEVQDALNFKNYIGIDLYKEFSSFIRMDKYSNENYISDGLNNTELMQNAIEFISVATKELFKSATLQHSITGTIKNFLRMKEFEPVTNNFKNGNWICVGIDDKVYQLRIIEYEIDFDDTQNISVTFSDVVSLPDGMSDLESILSNSSKMATSYSGVIRQSTINTNFKNKMNEMITKGLSMTNTKIVSNADNQDITWDEHGLLCREYDDIISDYTDSQLKIINHGIYITDDNWKTARAGIGNFIYYDPKDKTYKESYGVIADTLVSNLILTSEVGIYNEEKSIEMAKDGIIVTTNTMNKNVFTIRKEITDDEGNVTYERQLYIDDNGNIVLGGNASISWDNITGTDNVVVKDGLDTIISDLQKEFSEKITNLEEQDDKKAETWYQETDPSTAWTTADEKKKHKGDLWYDTKNQVTKIYNGNSWENTKTTPPDDVFDKIGGKAAIYISQPKPPYNVGDLWINGVDILTCINTRTSGSYTSSDWVKKNTYTDDSFAKQVQQNLNNLKIGGRNFLSKTSKSSSITTSYNNTTTGFSAIDIYGTIGCNNNKQNGKTLADLGYQIGDEYTISFDYTTSQNSSKQIVLGTYVLEMRLNSSYVYTLSSRMQLQSSGHINISFKIANENQLKVNNLCVRIDNSTCVFTVSNAKLEKGNKATDWTPAPEDTESYVDNLAADLQEQIDGKIETFNQTSDPSSTWTTANIKTQHKGDIWYNPNTKVTQRYSGTVWETLYNKEAQEASTLAQKKAQVFVSTPTIPYYKGDLWFGGENGDIKTCTNTRTSGSYTASDWTKYNKYTDDSSLTTFIKDTYTTDVTDIRDQIDGKIETFRQETDPASAWTTSDLKKQHKGDIWYDTKNQKSYIYVNSSWSELKTTPPDSVFSSINSKAQIFVKQPTIPYQVGDLWFNGTDILTCTVSRASGLYTASDWVKKNTYTDDSFAKKVQENLNNLQIGGRNLVLNSYKLDGKWSAAGGYVGTTTVVQDSSALSKYHIESKCTTAGNGAHYPVFPKTSDKIGKTYTWSFEAKCSVAKTGSVGHECGGQTTISMTTEWKKFSHTWKFTDNQYHSFTFYLGFKAGEILYIRDFKIEEGSKATSWTPAPEDTETYADNLAADLKTQIDSKIETFNQTTDPSTSWTSAQKNIHKGDIWYNSNTKETKRYNGSTWDTLQNKEAQEASNLAQTKAQVFTGTPTIPYYKGDLWFGGTGSDIKTCTVTRTSGDYTASDWVKYNKYTDDSTANTVKNNLTNLSQVLGYDGTKLTGTYIYSPHIIGGELSIGDTKVNASISTSGKLTATGAEITGAIIATSGSFTGTVNANSGTFTNVDIQSGKIGGLTLASNSIQSSNGNFSVTSGGKLTATDAIITGNITATSGSFTGAITATSLTLSGCKIDYNTDIEHKPDIPDTTKFYRIGNSLSINPTGATSSFAVDSDGLLTAHNAVIFGTIHATNGDIGGFNITTTANNNDHAYKNTLYRIINGSDGYDYQAGIKGDSDSNTTIEAAFYVRKKLRNETWGDSTIPFFVRNDGYVYCENMSIGDSLYATGELSTKYDNLTTKFKIITAATDGVYFGLLDDTTKSRLACHTKGMLYELGVDRPFSIAKDGNLTYSIKKQGSINVDLGASGVNYRYRNLYIEKIIFPDDSSMTTAKTSGDASSYGSLTNKPGINGHTLASGNNTLVDLGIAARSHSHSISDISWSTTLGYKGFGHNHTMIYDGDGIKGISIAGSESPSYMGLIPYDVTYTNANSISLTRGGTMYLGAAYYSNKLTAYPFECGYFKNIKVYKGSGDASNIDNYITPSGGGSLTGGLTIKLNGTSQISSWKGASDVSVNITASSIGAATSNHSHDMSSYATKNWVKNTFGSTIDVSNGYLYLYNNNGSQLSSVQLPTSSGGNSTPSEAVAKDGTTRPIVTSGTAGSNTYTAWIGTYYESSSYVLKVNGKWSSSSWETHGFKSNYSDIRLKTNISNSNRKALDIINSIKIRQFDWIRSGEHQDIGFIADELETLDKHFAFGGGYEEDGSMNIKSVDSLYLQGYEVKAIQELSQENQKLKNTILSLQGEIAIIKQKLEELA